MRRRQLMCLLFGLIFILGLAGIQVVARPPASSKLWHRDLYKAHNESVESNKPMLIVFSADWGG